jgi:hypothetical protein
MKIGDRVTLKPKTLKGKNLLQNRGATGIIERIQAEKGFYSEPPAIQIRFDKEPHRPCKVVEDIMEAWRKAWPEMDFEHWRNWAYATEYNLWVEIKSSDFDIEVNNA